MNEELIPNAGTLYDEKEHDQHNRAIERLAQELRVPTDEIQRSYMEILADLKKEAKVRAFLPVLVSRCVKERFQRRKIVR